MVGFAGDLFAAGQDCLDVLQGDSGRAAVVALDRAGDELSLELVVFVVKVVSLGRADFLDDHLLGRLGADSLVDLFRRHDGAVVRPGNGTRAAVDRDLHFLFFAVVFFGSGDDRRFDALEDDFLIDILVAVDCIHDAKQFAGVHRLKFSTS